MTTSTFNPGITYTARSIGDHNCVFRFTVIKRTAKFITVTSKMSGVQRVGISDWDGVESAFPEGKFSMAPIIRADRFEVAS